MQSISNNTIFDPDNFHGYSLLQRCGSGAYGEVWKAEEKLTGKHAAVKIIKKDENGRWRDELAGIKHYRQTISAHPNLLAIYHVEENNEYFYYSMELADNQDESCKTYRPDTLSNRLATGSIKLEPLLKIINLLLDGLEVLHKSGLVHHDIKPENIIFVEGIPKLSDVGLVSGTTHASAGTPGFVPKILTGDASGIQPGNYTDLYAMGKVIYCALTGLDAKEFPIWPSAMLSPSYRSINHFLLNVCSENPQERFADVAAFRHSLCRAIVPEPPPMPIKGGKSGIISFVLGLAGTVAWFIPLFGLPITLTGLILGIRGLRGKHRRLAVTGLVLSIIFLIVTVANSAIGAYRGITKQDPLLNLLTKPLERHPAVTPVPVVPPPKYGPLADLPDENKTNKADFSYKDVYNAAMKNDPNAQFAIAAYFLKDGQIERAKKFFNRAVEYGNPRGNDGLKLCAEKEAELAAQANKLLNDKDAAVDKSINFIRLWNTHNWKYCDRGADKVKVEIFHKDKLVFASGVLDMPWQVQNSPSLDIRFPENIDFDRVRINIMQIHGRGGGLAEVQVFVKGKNIARGCTTQSSSIYNGVLCTSTNTVDGVAEDIGDGIGYWLLKSGDEPGWLDLFVKNTDWPISPELLAAAQHDDALAQEDLASYYEHNGNIAEAIKWSKLATGHIHNHSSYMQLGNLYLKLIPGIPDRDEKARLYREIAYCFTMAIENFKKDPSYSWRIDPITHKKITTDISATMIAAAQTHLSELYSQGLGLSTNPDEAAKQQAEAIECLPRYRQQWMQEIAKHRQEEKLAAEANKLARAKTAIPASVDPPANNSAVNAAAQGNSSQK